MQTGAALRATGVGSARLRTATACALLAALACLVFAPTLGHGWFAMDDDLYVAANPTVSGGLSAEGIRWAFTSVGYAANWHPLTWLSLMLEASLLGSTPAVHHLGNVLLHAAAAALLLAFLAAATGSLPLSLLAAALFALHPLRVESVAWIAERKDVLGALGWMVAMAAWLAWLRRPTPWRMAGATALFAVGLLAKPMLVTLPFALLLLDAWPFGRLRSRRDLPRLALEKAPLLLLSAGASWMTMLAQSRGGLVAPPEAITPAIRVGNALVSVVSYLRLTLWPAGLAFYYPHPGRRLPVALAVGAAVALALVTAAALLRYRRQPYLATGWLWFLGTLVPVLGLVQVGTQGMADRYTYLPHVGLLVALVWGGSGLAARLRLPAAAVRAVAVAAVAAVAILAWRQVGIWRSSESVYRHSLAKTERNWLVHNNLADLLLDAGRPAEAVEQYRASLAIRTFSAATRLNLGVALAAVGRADEAAAELEIVLRSNPDGVEALYALANIRAGQGRLPEAAGLYRRALAVRPADSVHNNLGAVLSRMGDIDGALRNFAEAARLNPANAEARNNYAAMLASRGMAAEAIGHYRAALAIRPDYLRAMLNLAGLLRQIGRAGEAADWYRRALALDPANPEARAALAVTAEATSGRM
jgi:tetratricopeptide (TPR) repeat protein